MVSELVPVLISALFELSVDIQDMALVGEESRVIALLLVEDQGAGESRSGWFGEITSNPLLSGLGMRTSSVESGLSCSFNVSRSLSTSTVY